MKFSDEELLKAIQEVRDKRLESISQLEQDFQDFEAFSPEFLGKMDQMLHGRKKRSGILRTIRRVAAVLLAFLICGGMWLAIDMDARAAFFTWTREAYEGSFVYRFFNSAEVLAVLPDYEITDLPEGYELITSKSNDISGVKLYGLGDAQIVFMFYFANDNSNTKIITHSDTAQLDTSIMINGQSADFYIFPDGSEANLLFWIDENEKIAFSISSFLDQDIMIQMAESVSKN